MQLAGRSRSLKAFLYWTAIWEVNGMYLNLNKAVNIYPFISIGYIALDKLKD